MWEINNNLQAVSFLRALILGFIYCICYDILKALRKVGLNSKRNVFTEDIIYFILISPITSIFLLATTNGELRFYIIIGIIFGFLSFKLTVSKFFVFILEYIFKKIYYFLKSILNIIDKFRLRCNEICINTENILKKVLKKA